MCAENRSSSCSHVLVGAVVAAFGIVNSSALGQCQANELVVLTDSKRPDAGAFGVSVAIDGGTAVIGDVSDNDNGVNAGAAWVFQLDGSNWVQQQKLLAADGAASDVFGGTVAISGDIIVIGARRDDDNGNNSGSAYVFRFDPDTSNWIQEQKLLPDDGHFSDYFGISVAVSGDIALIGAYFKSIIPGITAGAAYVFRDDGSSWVQEQKLLPDSPSVAANFGISVALEGDVAVIGAYFDDDLGDFSGSVYVFRFDDSSWVFEHKLLAADGGPFDEFGLPVAISGETVVVGAQRHDEFGPQSGAAYMYRFDGSTWHQEQELLPGDGAAFDGFGRAVAVAGDTAVIGAWFDDNENGIDAGSVYAYRFDGNVWIEQAKLTPTDTGDGYQFGWSAALSGDVALFGEGHLTFGSVGVFRGLSDCNENGTLDICDIASGASSDLNGNGIPDECEGGTVGPDDFTAFRGFYVSGDLNSLLASDDSDLCYEPGIVLNPTEAPVTLDFFGTLPNDAPSTLDVTIESSANTVGLELTISFWNFNTNTWDVVGTDTQSLNTDTVRTFAGIPADHVEPVTGEVRTRYEVRVVSFIFLFPWLDCVDHVVWTITN